MGRCKDLLSNVLIYSQGNAEMQMGLSFPVDKSRARDRDVYYQPHGLRIPLSPGTLLVYSCFDDLFFCHEARFQTPDGVGGARGEAALYRVAFVFRWLRESEERLYYVDPRRGGRFVPSSADEKRWKAPKATNRRKGPWP